MNPNHAVQFAFADQHDAAMAFATLHELGYSPVRNGDHVHIHLERGDLTSALEVTMAHGGQLCGQAAMDNEAVIESAYDMDAIPIPAHTVNEDLPDLYMEASGELGDDGKRNRNDDDTDGLFDPDGSLDFFPGDVKA
ncbi:hypothetical protein BG53_09640 [Paenibacillus darwinianus]|uniref:DNA/RNA helicase n=1 Tax=Paenibacillus darwinianus TaxID=1380763 RepID=A0A9W5RZG8_9BACL|nr:hypothetical protein [Paenibacillus darwinianus]EXX85066.1 hypothetical protein BG53_09640 [Paenibacillus darwinianus]EXX85118.1 hypothetical protein CH50_10120 [Paenibacillus darwinianus]EXX86403.1 hypothetical protein BG52_06540 [Paenibacillus darwinianus]